MRTRFLKTKPEKLKENAEGFGKQALADALGIHLTTLNSLIDDTWERVERDTLERVCDYLDCDLEGFLTLEDSSFWEPFRMEPSYIVRGTPYRRHGSKASLEEAAKARVSGFCAPYFPLFGGFAPSLKGDREIVAFLRDNNAVIVGAHESNRAFEIALCRLYSATPFDASLANRRKIPFRFVGKESAKKSSYLDPIRSNSKDSVTPAPGIYSEVHGSLIVEVDRWPKEEFLSRPFRRVRDAGMVIVSQSRFGEKDVKTILLGGFSRSGTEAAAAALVRDYRDLEPDEGEIVFGVLEVTYRKPGSEDYREITGFKWKCRIGGRRPVGLPTS